MANQADIPSDLTNDDKALIFQQFDSLLNSMILHALLHGMYTGILAVTLWNIFINKCWQIRQGLVVIIMLLYGLTTINLATEWSYIYSAFIKNRENFGTVYLKLTNSTQSAFLVEGIASTMSTIITDLYMIWCCWTVWGQHWLVVLLSILSLIAASVLKILITYRYYNYGTISNNVIFQSLYPAFVLATTLWCTILIIYRILTIAGVKHGAGGYYLEVIAGIAKGVALTLLIGQAAAGHTHPNDDDSDNTVSSLHFQIASSEVGTTSYQESTINSTVHEIDIEAQQEQSDGLVEVVERMESCLNSYSHSYCKET
ncbi:hypothetical protein ARMGADRAFT_1029257 [Armillaria gallica]|uniref:Uncharacterized protein n=1 Tax=Armillaria gallica TaxID=47427 RepID=A0A2H3E2X9_ARMGA|nr:hypothetical protein ARMGADRAFT_1029257 [Armillaria gallica]